VLNALFVCNGQYCGGGMQVGAGASVDDGLFLVVEAGGVSRLRSILEWPRLYRGLEHVRGVRIGAGRIVEVASEGDDEVLVDCDGEVCGALPASYRIVPDALDVVVP
jgi:diacylglycerol kinase (ATP)